MTLFIRPGYHLSWQISKFTRTSLFEIAVWYKSLQAITDGIPEIPSASEWRGCPSNLISTCRDHTSSQETQTFSLNHPDNKVHGANIWPNWVLSAPDGPHVGAVNLAIRGGRTTFICACKLSHHDWHIATIWNHTGLLLTEPPGINNSELSCNVQYSAILSRPQCVKQRPTLWY